MYHDERLLDVVANIRTIHKILRIPFTGIANPFPNCILYYTRSGVARGPRIFINRHECFHARPILCLWHTPVYCTSALLRCIMRPICAQIEVFGPVTHCIIHLLIGKLVVVVDQLDWREPNCLRGCAKIYARALAHTHTHPFLRLRARVRTWHTFTCIVLSIDRVWSSAYARESIDRVNTHTRTNSD